MGRKQKIYCKNWGHGSMKPVYIKDPNYKALPFYYCKTCKLFVKEGEEEKGPYGYGYRNQLLYSKFVEFKELDTQSDIKIDT